MKIRHWGGLCALFLLLGATPALAARVILDASSQVIRGEAFPAIARTDAAVDSVVFQWMGKKYSVPTLSQQDGPRVARILLPVPLDAKDKTQSLTVMLRGTTGEAQAQLALVDKERPVQKLTVDKKYVNPPASEQARIAEDRRKVQTVAGRYTQAMSPNVAFMRPVPGDVSSQFGLKRVFNGQPRSVHKGLDLRGAMGTPILAAADGVVVLVDNLYFSGNVVYVDHGLGVITGSLHMSETLVQLGEFVRRGQVIGKVGATGRVTGPHLHLSMLVQGVPVDPLPLLHEPYSQSPQNQ